LYIIYGKFEDTLGRYIAYFEFISRGTKVTTEVYVTSRRLKSAFVFFADVILVYVCIYVCMYCNIPRRNITYTRIRSLWRCQSECGISYLPEIPEEGRSSICTASRKWNERVDSTNGISFFLTSILLSSERLMRTDCMYICTYVINRKCLSWRRDVLSGPPAIIINPARHPVEPALIYNTCCDSRKKWLVDSHI